MSLPDGPRGPLQSLGWALRPIPYLETLRERYGDTFTLRLAHEPPWVVLSRPEHVREVFTGDPAVLRAGEGNAILEPLLGSRSVLLLDGPEHLRERKRLLPPFHGERMQAYGALIEAIAERELASWPPDRPLRMRPRMQALTLQVIMEAVFGSADPELRARLQSMLDLTTDGRRMALMFALGPRAARRLRVFDAMLRPSRARLDAEIAARRVAGDLAAREDILSLLIRAGMDDASLADELLTLLVAGHETTATALAWALERLARHPSAWARLRADPEGYAQAVARETLRLRPVLPVVIRKLAAPLRIAGLDLRAGVAVAPCIVLLHRRADLYPEPHAFRPERFLDATPGTYEWIPFGGGVRRCIGASFALFEMTAVLRVIARRFTWLGSAAATSEPAARRAITLVPGRGAALRAVPASRTPPVPAGR